MRKFKFRAFTLTTDATHVAHSYDLRCLDAKTHKGKVCYENKNSHTEDNSPKYSVVNRTLLRKKAAFTLAEVLITLGIIGVVAALTLPSLIQNYHEKQRVTQLKKAYSVMQNAFLMAQEEYGDVTDWGLTKTYIGKDDDGNNILDNSGTENVMNILMKYVEKSKIPQNSYIGYVESIDGRQAFWPWEVSADKYFYLKDGTMVTMGWISSLDCNGDYQGKKIACSDFWIAFPKKSKMKIGVDVFNFIFTKEGFKPNSTTSGAKCNAFEAVGSADTNGRGCTAHALYNGNMDYLHKKDWQ